VAAASQANGTTKTFFPYLTWVEAAEAAERGVVVLLPVGTVDSNGPHLPMGFDYVVSERLAQRVAEETGNLWLPPIAFGVSDALAAYPGTIAIPPEVLAAQLEAVLTSLIRGGFTRVVVINNHNPNQPPAEAACRRVRRTHGISVPVVFPAELTRDLGQDLLKENPGSLGHGSEPGTSLLLHLLPNEVRTDLFQADSRRTFNGLEVLSPTEVRFRNGRVRFFFELEEVSETGRWGDPSSASSALGEKLFSRLVDYTSEFVREFATMDPSLPLPAIAKEMQSVTSTPQPTTSSRGKA
jgi:creatinine amidohydrolase